MPRLGVTQQTAVLRANVVEVADSLLAEDSLPAPAGVARLVLLMGLPASGKSHFAGLLADRVSGVVVATDALRRRLFIAPSYGRAESATVFAVAHALAQRLLERGHVVIVDATNLRESHRAPLYALAKAASAPAILVRVVAPESAIRERLTLRAARSSPADASDADWAIYQLMVERQEEPSRPYLTVDSGGDLQTELARVEEAIRTASA
ncbi:MAG: ATP-binding protein [Chloroflexi bacterium]|nr:MAG: ATP-binding protein [Chloroflexota bacterium]